ncbi:MAG: transcription elongation factor Spt5 [Candidatus Nezhaarchaeota archaeon]|nr:transcription elongation factor Spt5 [Candidatus Nezhaarchaeota archaeon]MCX8142107.1 transcription elongation factor Spt5 [Candidatus Nezhaarchaeota archaeon]MDW8050112.1 transcription elongation factor Spt5 [Nitrososphaerota archaeon]
MSEVKPSFYLIRTTIGQEKSVAMIAEDRVRRAGIPIKSIVVVDGMRGYVVVETDRPDLLDKVFYGIKHMRGIVAKKVSFDEVESFLVPRPSIEGIEVGDIVEIIAGPLKGLRGTITRVDRGKEEVTLELHETSYSLPITVHGDYVKVVEKTKKVS